MSSASGSSPQEARIPALVAVAVALAVVLMVVLAVVAEVMSPVIIINFLGFSFKSLSSVTQPVKINVDQPREHR